MPFFSDDFIEQLRDKVSLVDLIGRTVRLVRKGHTYWGKCPFHAGGHEKTGSFTVDDTKGFYHCFGCHEHGDVFKFVQESQSVSFIEAVEYLAEYAGIPVPKPSKQDEKLERRRLNNYELLEQICCFYQEQLYQSVGKEGLLYLRNRGLSDETIKKFRLGFAPAGNKIKEMLDAKKVPIEQQKELGVLYFPEEKGKHIHDYFRDRVMFPIFDKKGKVIAFGGRIIGEGDPKYLNSPVTPFYKKENILYGLNFASEQARKRQTILVVEGYMDVISLHAAGIPLAVATCGTAIGEEHIKLLWRHSPEPICCFDGDTAGINAANRAANVVLPVLGAGLSLNFLTLPDDLDPDEYIKEYGQASFEKFMETEKRPLMNHLWQMLTENRSLETPERKASLEKDIRETLSHITDETVRNFYYTEFKNRLWGIVDGNKTKQNYFKKKTVEIHPVPKPQKGISQAKIILAYMALYPNQSAVFVEQLSELKMPNAGWQKTFDVLLKLISSGEEILPEQVHEKLAEIKALGLYNTSEVEMLMSRDQEKVNINKDLQQILDENRKLAIQDEITSILQKLKSVPPEEQRKLYDRMISLKQSLETGD